MALGNVMGKRATLMDISFYTYIVAQLHLHPNYTQVVKTLRTNYTNLHSQAVEQRTREHIDYGGLLIEELPSEFVDGHHKYEAALAMFESATKRCTSIRIAQRCHDAWYNFEGESQWVTNRIGTSIMQVNLPDQSSQPIGTHDWVW